MVSNLTHYHAAKVLHCKTWLEDGVVSVDESGKIVAIEQYDPERHPSCVDLPNQSLMPGLIDTHVHGAMGCDVMDASHDSSIPCLCFLLSKG